MISFVNSLSGSYFLWDVPDLAFDIRGGERAFVSFSDEDGQIYAEYLWPVNGRITLRELPSLLLETTERKLHTSFSVRIVELNALETIDEKNISFSVIYANVETGMSPGTFAESFFLSTFQGTRRTAQGRLEYLHYLGSDSPSATAHYSDGSTAQFTPEVTSSARSYRQINVSPDRFTAQGKTLVWYEVTVGARRQEYEIDYVHTDAAPILLFRNSFGVDELAYCTGIHQVAPEFVRSSSVIDGKFRNYEIEEKRWFNADTGILTTEEAQWFHDVFRSKEVHICNVIGGQLRPGKEIALTDSKAEIDNADGSLPRFTFKYRYAQRQQNVLQMQRTGRIFDNTFDSTFD